MKQISNLNFRPLRFNKGYYVLNRFWESIKRPRHLSRYILILYLGHIGYIYVLYKINSDFSQLMITLMDLVLITLAGTIVFIINTIVFCFVFVILQLLIKIMLRIANFTTVRSFMKMNGIKPIMDSNTIFSSSFDNSSEVKNLMPPSTQVIPIYEGISRYSFKIKTEKNYPITLLQFKCSTEMLYQADLYFLCAKLKLKTSKKSPHIYLDNYKNGTSVFGHVHQEDLQLEGDFYNDFKLFHELKAEASSRQILTPDVMEFLVNSNTPYDYEFLDKELWIIAKGYHMTKQDLIRICRIADMCIETIN